MLFHPEKKAEKWIDAAEFVYLCYYESDDDECGPSLMEFVRLFRREGLHTFWFLSDSKAAIEELRHTGETDAYFLFGPTCLVQLIGSLGQPEHFENSNNCLVRFTAKECWINTNFGRKKILIV